MPESSVDTKPDNSACSADNALAADSTLAVGSTSAVDNALAVGSTSGDRWSVNAVYFEYTRAADPLASGSISPVPCRRFGAECYQDGPSRVVPLDLAEDLGVASPATSPGLCANFVRIVAGDMLEFDPNASSQLFHVMRGRGTAELGDRSMAWEQGDFLTLPAGSPARHRAAEDSVLYWVHDEPLLRFLGARATEPRFAPTRYPAADARRCLDQVAADPEAASRSRISVLLANRAMDQTLTVTNVLWAMFGVLPAGDVQPPHRHQSVALDLIVSCEPGCYTMLGDLADDGRHLVRTQRVDWEPGAAFVTPPGKWHSHHNESGADAHLIPIQDAGLQTYLRALDIRFMSREQAADALPPASDVGPGNSLAGQELSGG